MIGTTMIVRIRLAVKTLAPVVCGGAEDRDEAERVVQPGLEGSLHERRQDQDAPEAEDDAGDRGQHLDQRADHPPHPGRRQQAQIEPNRDRDRGADRQRGEGADDRPEEQRAGTEDAEVGLPGRFDEEAEAKSRDRRLRPDDHLVGDRQNQHQTEQRGEGADAEEQAVGNSVELLAALS